MATTPATTPVMAQPTVQQNPTPTVVPQTAWEKVKAAFFGTMSSIYVKVLFIIFIIFLILFIGAIINKFSSTERSQSSENNGQTISGPQMKVIINGKDTLITIGQYFEVPFTEKKPQKPSISFDGSKNPDYQLIDQTNPNLWKENGGGKKVSGDQSLPASWENDRIYIWSKGGGNGVAKFRIKEMQR